MFSCPTEIRSKSRHGRIDGNIHVHGPATIEDIRTYMSRDAGWPGKWKSEIGCLTYVFAFTVNTIEDRLVSRLSEPRLLPRLLIVLVSVTETFGTEVESIAEGFVDACESVVAGHEDLGIGSVSRRRYSHASKIQRGSIQ